MPLGGYTVSSSQFEEGRTRLWTSSNVLMEIQPVADIWAGPACREPGAKLKPSWSSEISGSAVTWPSELSFRNTTVRSVYVSTASINWVTWLGGHAPPFHRHSYVSRVENLFLYLFFQIKFRIGVFPLLVITIGGLESSRNPLSSCRAIREYPLLIYGGDAMLIVLAYFTFWIP